MPLLAVLAIPEELADCIPNKTSSRVRESHFIVVRSRVEVLDKGYVELQSLMGDDLAIVNAARVSFLGESKGADKDKEK